MTAITIGTIAQRGNPPIGDSIHLRALQRRGGGLCPASAHRRRDQNKSNSCKHFFEGRQAALMSMILYLSALPRGVVTSTVSPFFLPMIALPTGDSFESLFSDGFASAEPTM